MSPEHGPAHGRRRRIARSETGGRYLRPVRAFAGTAPGSFLLDSHAIVEDLTAPYAAGFTSSERSDQAWRLHRALPAVALRQLEFCRAVREPPSPVEMLAWQPNCTHAIRRQAGPSGWTKEVVHRVTATRMSAQATKGTRCPQPGTTPRWPRGRVRAHQRPCSGPTTGSSSP